MAKIGKYSTGIGSAQPKSAPYVNSNGGYDKRENMMGENGLKKHESEAMGGGHTATGNPVLMKTKRVTRKT
jgi:hypothetical protein